METANTQPGKGDLRVFLVDDYAPIRGRLAGLLRALEGIDIVGEAETPAAATSGILDSNPDTVLLDLQLNGGTGLDVLKAIHPARPDIVFIVLTNHASSPYRRKSMACGASYFLDKTHDFEQVATIIGALRSSKYCQ